MKLRKLLYRNFLNITISYPTVTKNVSDGQEPNLIMHK